MPHGVIDKGSRTIPSKHAHAGPKYIKCELQMPILKAWESSWGQHGTCEQQPLSKNVGSGSVGRIMVKGDVRKRQKENSLAIRFDKMNISRIWLDIVG